MKKENLSNAVYDVEECESPDICTLLGIKIEKFQPNHIYDEVANSADCYDCQIRTIAKLFNISWEEAFRRLCEVGLRIGTVPNHNLTLKVILTENGFQKIYDIDDVKGDPILLSEFLYEMKFRKGMYAITLIQPPHVISYIDGIVYDRDIYDYMRGAILASLVGTIYRKINCPIEYLEGDE